MPVNTIDEAMAAYKDGTATVVAAALVVSRARERGWSLEAIVISFGLIWEGAVSDPKSAWYDETIDDPLRELCEKARPWCTRGAVRQMLEAFWGRSGAPKTVPSPEGGKVVEMARSKKPRRKRSI